jgi:oxygen-independent coproporphyrinogen-3 oxidase
MVGVCAFFCFLASRQKAKIEVSLRTLPLEGAQRVGGDQARIRAAEMAGLYVHIPFCLRKCPYCDFYSIADLSPVPAFLEALKKEISLVYEPSMQFDSLYIGGGTPSVLKPHDIEDTIRAAKTHFKILPDCEITIEINPGTVKSEDLNKYKKIGINRINIGVQSFRDDNLKFLGRIHSAQSASDTIKQARRAGFKNLGLDLMYCLPGQTQSSWIQDLGKAVSFEPQHLACYMLTYEQGTPLDRDRQKGCFQPMDERRVAELFQTTTAFLGSHGYQHYEISNFAVSETLCSRHNQKYWSFAPYIGLGPSAHSFIPPMRYWNHSDVTSYIDDLASARLPVSGKEQLTVEQQIIEAVYLGLRRTEGIDLDVFEQRFGTRFFQRYQKELKTFEEKNYLQTTQSRCALTPQGMLFLDSIAAALTSKDLT